MARRVRMLGMLFDADKTFLVPQALPGIRYMVEMQKKHPNAKMLAVGHAAGDEALAGGTLAIARAQSLVAYLTLVTAYLDIEGTTLEEGTRVDLCGCEGHVDDDPAKDGMAVDDRRVELFFFEPKITPKPPTGVLSPVSPELAAWRAALVETADFENHGIHVQIVDDRNRPVPGAAVKLDGPISADGLTDDCGFVSFFELIAGEYEIALCGVGPKLLNYASQLVALCTRGR